MAIAIASAGIKVSYAVETMANTRPTTGYIHIPDIKEIPDMNPAPETLETTSLDNTEFKTYINGLKDLGGALQFNANLTQNLFDIWNGSMDALEDTSVIGSYEKAKGEGKHLWLCVDIPGLNKSTFFTFEPAKIGMPGASVNAVLETPLYITPTSEPVWADDPTYQE